MCKTAVTMTAGDIAEAVAAKIGDRLGNGHVIGATWPPEIGERVRKARQGGSWVQHETLWLDGGYALTAQWHFHGSGAITLQMFDVNNSRFWEGTFYPVAEREPAERN